MVEILNKKVVFKSKPFEIVNADIYFPNKKIKKNYDYIKKKDSTMIVPMTNDGNFILIKEWGVGIDDYFLTFPKGGVEKNDNLIESSNKELQEEAGYKAQNYVKIGIFDSSPTNMTHRTHLYLARELTKSKLDTGDEIEKIEVMEVSNEEIKEFIFNGKLCEPRSIAAFYLIISYLENIRNK